MTAPPNPPADTDVAAVLESLQETTRRLVRGVDGCAPERLVEPSLLPGWTRAHVVAHLALNAEALAGVLTIVADGGEAAMYASSEQRDADVDELATAPAAELRARLLASTTRFDETARGLAEAPGAAAAWARTFTRVPGSAPAISVGAVPGMREREVEIHHADLGLGYRPAQWPPAFAARLLETMLTRDGIPSLRLHATDLDRTWQAGPTTSEPLVVRGPAAEIGWWLSGRDAGPDLTSEHGELPRIEEW